MQFRARKKLLGLTAVIATSGLTFAALPAHAGEVGVSSSEIKFGMTVPMTGTASLGYNKIPGAVKAYFE